MDTGSILSGSKTSRGVEEHHSTAGSYADDILGNVLSNLDNLAMGAPVSPARDIPDMGDDIFHQAIRSTPSATAASIITDNLNNAHKVKY